jgi:NAD(P)-dependent dehydrogenase (short-subunit alcohol dehydrogenase family)
MSGAKDKVAIVLGASARNGIGWACAKRLADEGAKVVVAARSFDTLSALAKPEGMLPVRCDASSRSDIEALAAAAIERHGRIDIAINSAGRGEVAMIADTTEEMLRRSFEMNFLPMFHFVQVMASAMGERRDDDMGSIVLVSTMSVEHPMPGVFSYAAAKGATDTLVRYAALEYGPRKIRVNSINPGLVLTDLARSSDIDDLDAVAALATDATALKRIATPADCADAAYWLGTSAFVTGTHVKVAGGGHIRPQFG